MKKRIRYLFVIAFVLSISAISVAQNVPIDFEEGGNGATWTWTVFENDTNPPVEIIPNPDMSGANTSATVAKFTALQTGNPWAGCESLHGSDIGTFTLDSTNCVVKIMVWKSVISDVGIKFVQPDGGALPEIKVANTLTNQWEELTFDFSSRIGHPSTIDQDQIVIFPDFDLGGRAQDNICYFDNITFSEQTPLPEPLVEAPDPIHINVFSIYSDSYTNLENTNFNPSWGQATVVTDELLEENNTLKYAGLNFQGTNLGSSEGTDQDVSEYTHFHVDFWTPNATTLNFFLISRTTGERSYSLPITTEQWVSVDIPLDHFTGLGLGLTDIFQFKIDGGDGATTVVWFDNWYFHSGDLISPRVQVIHNSADAAAAVVDVWLNDQRILNDFAFRTASPFIDAPAGVDFDITIQPSTSSDTTNGLWRNTYNLTPGQTYVLVADGIVSASGYSPATAFDIYVYAMGQEVAAQSGNTDVLVFHGATDAPTVDVVEVGVGAGTIVDDLSFGEFQGYLELGTQDYRLDVRDATGTTTVASYEAPLATLGLQDSALVVFASGFLDPVQNSNGPAFGLWVALANGAVVELPLVSSIEHIEDVIPNDYTLSQNFPNPFNPSTKIRFSLLQANQVTLKVYNMLGQEVATLVDEFMQAGTFEVNFEAAELPTGTYFYTITAGEFKSVKKMLLIK